MKDVIGEIVAETIRTFPWPKSMRWGKASVSTASLRWVRPLHSILCTFGPETAEPDVISVHIDDVTSSNVTFGHRFMKPEAIRVRRLDDYLAQLEMAKVVADPVRRRDIILNEARTQCFALGLELVEDEGLATEVAGLVEWPVVLIGSFDPAFLDIPDEVIRATIRANQKCFVVRDPKTGRLANKFVLTANIEAKDGGAAIIAGNERVIRARLSDALYFWQTDQKPLPDYDASLSLLHQRLEKIKALNIVFHEKLGTQGERIERIKALAAHIAPLVGADVAQATRAAELCKADLVTEVVGEFPEVQGLMGRKYAALQGEPESICIAIEDHYKPQGPSDRVPTDKVAIAVALADKIDTLVGFWAIDEKPTGSKDPFALRRAALGVIRIVLENDLKIELKPLLDRQFEVFDDASSVSLSRESLEFGDYSSLSLDLLSFFHDRLKVYLRDQGARHDLIDAVLGSADNDNLLLITRRVEALAAFLASDDGTNLLAGFRRAANILRAEEKKDGTRFEGAPDAALLALPEEKAFAAALTPAAASAAAAVQKADFAAAMGALAPLRPVVDAFFDKVTVNADDPAIRINRLKLLANFRDATAAVADFSKVAQ